MSQCSYYSYELDKCDKEKSLFGDFCLSYEFYDDYSFFFVVLEKIGIGCSERSVEDKVEMSFFFVIVLKFLKNDWKVIFSYAKTTKIIIKKDVVIVKGFFSCNIKISFDIKRQCLFFFFI